MRLSQFLDGHLSASRALSLDAALLSEQKERHCLGCCPSPGQRKCALTGQEILTGRKDLELRLPVSCEPYPNVRPDASRLLIAVVTLTGLCFSSSVNEIISSWKTFRLFLFKEVGKDPRIAALRSVQANEQPSRDFASWKALGPHKQALKFLCKTNSCKLGQAQHGRGFCSTGISSQQLSCFQSAATFSLLTAPALALLSSRGRARK